MAERSLAHIEKVIAIEEIPGADHIELAKVLGWQCVVKKGDFKVGDLAAYVEIDAIVPVIPYFEFMKDRKYRVKTIKLRKTLSQGLLIPWKDIITLTTVKSGEWVEGKDFTEKLNITKYESRSDKEQNYVPKKKHNFFIRYMTRYSWFRKIFKMRSKSFPEWIPKTDEERIQNIPSVLNNKELEYYATEKLDGQSATYWIKKKFIGYEYGICSRTVRKSEFDGSNWSKVFKSHDLKKKLKDLRILHGGDIAIQGEIIGPNIQGGKYHNNKHIDTLVFPLDFYVFNMYDVKERKYLDFHKVCFYCCNFDINTVPVVDRHYILPNSVEDALNDAEGKSVLAYTEREGIVVRSYDQKVSFKVISNKFLMKEKDD